MMKKTLSDLRTIMAEFSYINFEPLLGVLFLCKNCYNIGILEPFVGLMEISKRVIIMQIFVGILVILVALGFVFEPMMMAFISAIATMIFSLVLVWIADRGKVSPRRINELLMRIIWPLASVVYGSYVGFELMNSWVGGVIGCVVSLFWTFVAILLADGARVDWRAWKLKRGI